MVRTVERQALFDFCKALGIDPRDVNRIRLDNEKVTIEQDYRVVSTSAGIA